MTDESIFIVSLFSCVFASICVLVIANLLKFYSKTPEERIAEIDYKKFLASLPE